MKRLLYLVMAALMVLAVSCKQDNPKGKYGVDGKTPLPEAVDLGLSVKWASFNLGASRPEAYGDYYAWGETEPKRDYSWSTYRFGFTPQGPFSKYNTQSSYGPVDNNTELDTGPGGDDVASKKLGGNWRMPTLDDFNELLALKDEAAKENSDYTWDKWAEVKDANGNGVHGLLITRKSTGATLFLPAAGYYNDIVLQGEGSAGRYWSSSLYLDFPDNAYRLYFGTGDPCCITYLRHSGLSIRPVCAE